MKEKLSVIVPVYNKEGYLERSLTTLRNQTYQDIEVIIVDDGSTDKSKEVCMKFCAEDNRFKYYYKIMVELQVHEILDWIKPVEDT